MGRSRPHIGYRHSARQHANPKWCKKHGKVDRPNEVDGDSYLKRGVALLELGFRTYEEYLASGLWASVRIAAYQLHGGKCLICKSLATAIHHLDYASATLRGLNMRSLIPICEACHKRVEFDGERKRPVHEVRQVTLSLLPKEPVVALVKKKKCVGCHNQFSPKYDAKGRKAKLCNKCYSSRSLD